MAHLLTFRYFENSLRLKHEIRQLAQVSRNFRSLHPTRGRKPAEANAAIMEKAYLMQLRLDLELQLERELSQRNA